MVSREGIVEIVLRAINLLWVALILLTSAIAVGKLDDLSSSAEDFINDSDDEHDRDSDVPDTPNLVDLSRGEGGFLIFFAIVVIAYEVTIMVLRFVNPSLLEENITAFLIVDVVVTGIVAFIFLVTGSVAGYYAVLWAEWVDYGEDNKDVISSSDLDDGEDIQGAFGATCAFAIFEVLTLIVLAVWLVMTIVFKWSFKS